MSKLNVLLEQYCPDGVEYYKIGELIKKEIIVTVKPTIKIKQEDYKEKGPVPIISQKTEYISGYCDIQDKRIAGGNYVCFGEHSENIKYVNFAFVQGAEGLKIMQTCESILKSRFLYYAISKFYIRRNSYERHFKHLSDTLIPVPPMPVQEEIVSILDKFNALTEELTMALATELTERRKQYEYYRGRLLRSGKKNPTITLGEIGPVHMCKRIMKSQTNAKGGVPYYKVGTLGKEPDAYISQETFEEYKQKYSFPRKGDILITAIGCIGRTVVYDGEPAYFQETAIVWLDNDETKVLNDFLMCCYKTEPWEISKSGRIPRLYSENIVNAVIPFPTIKQQRAIADKLARYETLCDDIEAALKEETEVRKKQFEYYRDKLLSFETLE